MAENLLQKYKACSETSKNICFNITFTSRHVILTEILKQITVKANNVGYYVFGQYTVKKMVILSLTHQQLAVKMHVPPSACLTVLTITELSKYMLLSVVTSEQKKTLR